MRCMNSQRHNQSELIIASAQQLHTLKINRIHHGCPVEIGKSQPEGPPVPVGNEARRVSHWNGGPDGWDFPFSTGHP